MKECRGVSTKGETGWIDEASRESIPRSKFRIEFKAALNDKQIQKGGPNNLEPKPQISQTKLTKCDIEVSSSSDTQPHRI